jgi:ARD/ARD' family
MATDMATLNIPDEKKTLSEFEEVRTHLAAMGIDYERWKPAHEVAAGASAAEILAAYAPEIERLKVQGGYVTADVIDVTPQTPGLEAMLNRFNSEHWHDEDEVRFIIAGFFIFIRAKERWFRLRWKRGICCACLAERGTGSICAKSGGFARFDCFKIRAVGRRITRGVAWTAGTSRCVLGRIIFPAAQIWAELGVPAEQFFYPLLPAGHRRNDELH